MRTQRRVAPFLFSLLACLSALVFSRQALAQAPSVLGIEGAALRCEPPVTGGCNSADSAGGNPHPNGVSENTINFEDCEANLYYQFEIGISNPSPSYNLEAWIGAEDCSQPANRQGGPTSACSPVTPFEAALVNQFVVNVRARDVASWLSATPHPAVYTGTGLANSDDAVCRSQTQTAAAALVLYLFFTDAEGNPYNTVQQYPITLDLRAGDVQGAISVSNGNDALVVNVPPTTDPDTVSYNVYCDPPPGQTISVGSDADAAAPSPTGCATSSVLAQGTSASMSMAFQYGQSDAKYLCATGSAQSSSIQVPGLKDGDYYDIAVASVDGAGNVGPLSDVACSEPTASAAAGGSGGVSCSTENAGAPAGTSGLGVLLLASILAMARKRG